MIARAPYLFLLLVILPDVYFDLRYWRHRLTTTRRLVYWLPTILLTALTLRLTYEPHFEPDNVSVLYLYLLLVALVAVPKWAYMGCSLLGRGAGKLWRACSSRKGSYRNYGNLIGALAVVSIWYVVLYGVLIGFNKLEVNHHTYSSPDLPKAFDGYRIVLFSDAHVGTMHGSRQWLLQRAVETINAQHADLIVFTGDLQNQHPSELLEHQALLSTLKANDGVYSVLGNHDYDRYYHITEENRSLGKFNEMLRLQKAMGWHLLLNTNRTISRGHQSITIAGMENDGNGKQFPQQGDVKRALRGAKPFVVMLEHDPSAWRRKIVPDGRAQLTLSGHTHNTQFALFGWSPMRATGKEINGWYQEGRQSLFVTSGLGGLIPFRFGAPAEIVVITLRTS